MSSLDCCPGRSLRVFGGYCSLPTATKTGNRLIGASRESMRPYVDRGYTLIAVATRTLLPGQAAGNLLNNFSRL